MFYIILFLMISMIADLHAMKKKEYTRSQSSPSENRDKNLSLKSLFSTSDPETTPKQTKQNVYINPGSSSGSDKEKSPRGLLKLSGKDLKKHIKAPDKYQETRNNEILSAVKENSFLKLLDLLYPNLNFVDEYGNTPLICAVKKNNNDMVKELLKQTNIDVNRADAEGNTPLHNAVMQENDIMVRLLLNDYRVNSMLRNIEKLTASAYNGEWQYKIGIKLLIFLRGRLDHLIDQEVPIIDKEVLILHMEFVSETNDIIDKAIIDIKKHIKEDYEEHRKKGQPLPDMSFPFKKKKFIKKMIIYRLQKLPTVHSQVIPFKKIDDIQDNVTSNQTVSIIIDNAYIT